MTKDTDPLSPRLSHEAGLPQGWNSPFVIVTDWKNFHEWATEAGHDESYFNIRDSKCLALQEQYLDECRELLGDDGVAPRADQPK